MSSSSKEFMYEKKGKRISLVIKSRTCTYKMWRDNWICSVENDIGGADIGMSKGMYNKRKNERAYNPDYITFHIFANLGQFASLFSLMKLSFSSLSLSLFPAIQLLWIRLFPPFVSHGWAWDYIVLYTTVADEVC